MPNPILTGTPVAPTQINQASSSDLPAWYQQYTQTLGSQAMGLAQANNAQPLPAQSVAGFNADQNAGFQAVRDNQGLWKPYMNAGMATNNNLGATSAKFVDYAQGVAAGPAMTTGSAVQPWAQGAQDAVSGSAMTTSGIIQPWVQGAQNAVSGPAQEWTANVSKYMSPYTSAVVDNIGRLGARNWEETIMPGVNSSMIGSGNFGSTRNADILSRAGVRAADDITGQQSNALQSGYSTSAGIFANDANRAQQQQNLQSQASVTGGNMLQGALSADANRAQQQQSLQAQTALSGGTMMQGALSADANRIQQQQQLQANTALTGGVNLTNAMNSQVDNVGALSQMYQTLGNTDAQSLLNIGNTQQQNQQAALNAQFNNATLARNDPWIQLQNAQGIINGTQLPKTTVATTSTPANVTGPSPLSTGVATVGAVNTLTGGTKP